MLSVNVDPSVLPAFRCPSRPALILHHAGSWHFGSSDNQSLELVWT